MSRPEPRLRRSMPPLRSAAIAASLVVALAAAGCSADDASDASASSTSGSASEAAARVEQAREPLDLELDLPEIPDGATALAGETVLLVPLSSAVFSVAVTAAEEALEALGAEPTVCDGKGNPSEMNSCLESATTLGAAAVISFAITQEMTPNAYQQLATAGIPVLAAWAIPDEDADADLFRTYDPIPDGDDLQLSTDYFLASDADRSALIIGNGQGPMQEGLSEEWIAYTEQECPDCAIETTNIADSQNDQVQSLVSSQLIKNPDTGAILGFNIDTFGPEIIQGVSGGSDRPLIGGGGSGGTSLGLIEQGRIDFVALTSTYFGGWAAVDALVREVTGTDEVAYPTAVRLIDETNIGDLDVSPENEASFDWFGEPTFIDQFTASWGVG